MALLEKVVQEKTTLGKLIAGIESPTSGEIDYNGQVVHKLKATHKRDFLQKVQFIFQDSTAALNPRLESTR